MPEISDLLRSTTPRMSPGFDVADLARRGRRRRRRAQMGTGIGAVAVIAAAAVGLDLVTPGEEGQGLVVASRPPTGELAHAFAAAAEPLGSWEQVADPPFSPRMGSFTGTASDGRVVVWGGATDADGGGAEGGGTLTDGAVYSPEAGTWEVIPAAPVSPGVSFHWTQLKQDRLMALGSPDGSEVLGAVYDLGSGEWTEIEAPPTIELPAEGVAWNGDALVLVRLSSGASMEKVARYTEPVVERWSYETGQWETGAVPPLSNRFGPAVAFDGDRLGVWGGATQSLGSGGPATGAELVGDGAVYDVATDHWEPMAEAPLQPLLQATATWLESGRLAIAGGTIEDRSGSPSMGISELGLHLMPVNAAAAYDPAAKTWTPLPQAPSSVYDAEMGVPYRVFGDSPFLAVDPRESGPHPMHVFDEVTGTWIEAPLRDLHSLDGTLVATSRTPDNPAGDPFEVQVLAGSVWEPATEAPFLNRMDAGVTVTGRALLVVGGAEGPDLEVTGDAWLLRFDVDAGD